MQFTHLQQLFFFSLLFGVTALFLWMIGEFLFPVFWALVIAIVFYPLYKYLVARLSNRTTLASLLTVLCVVMVILVPLISVAGLVVKESIDLYQALSSNGGELSGLSFFEQLERLNNHLEPIGVDLTTVEDRLRSTVSSLAQTIASSLLYYTQLTFHFVIKILITLYLLFFILKYGRRLREQVLFYLPLQDKYEDLLFKRFSETTQAIVQGTLVIAILQGLVGGVMLWLAGVSAPVLWGVIIAMLSIIPAVGPSFVLLPAGLFLIFTGSVFTGALLIGVGILLVTMVDEFLRPFLVGRRAKLPDAIVLLATLGGLASFGISGFVIGPILAAFCLSLWTIFGEKYLDQLTKNNNLESP